MNNSICTLFDNILIDIHKFKSLLYQLSDSRTFHQRKKLWKTDEEQPKRRKPLPPDVAQRYLRTRRSKSCSIR